MPDAQASFNKQDQRLRAQKLDQRLRAPKPELQKTGWFFLPTGCSRAVFSARFRVFRTRQARCFQDLAAESLGACGVSLG